MQRPMTPESDASDFDKEFLDACRELAATKVAEELLIHPNSILPEKALFERYQNEMIEELSTYKQRQKNGATKLSESLRELAIDQPELFTQEVIDGIERISSLSDRIAQDDKAFSDHILKGGTIQEFVGVDDKTMDCLYQGAKRLYDQDLLDDAADAFSFLTGLNADAHLFWLGLANAEFGRKNYKEALQAYQKVIERNPFDPSFHVALSQCYEALGEKDKALNAMNLALAAIEDHAEYADLQQGLEEEKLRLQQ